MCPIHLHSRSFHLRLFHAVFESSLRALRRWKVEVSRSLIWRLYCPTNALVSTLGRTPHQSNATDLKLLLPVRCFHKSRLYFNAVVNSSWDRNSICSIYWKRNWTWIWGAHYSAVRKFVISLFIYFCSWCKIFFIRQFRKLINFYYKNSLQVLIIYYKSRIKYLCVIKLFPFNIPVRSYFPKLLHYIWIKN